MDCSAVAAVFEDTPSIARGHYVESAGRRLYESLAGTWPGSAQQRLYLGERLFHGIDDLPAQVFRVGAHPSMLPYSPIVLQDALGLLFIGWLGRALQGPSRQPFLLAAARHIVKPASVVPVLAFTAIEFVSLRVYWSPARTVT